MNNYHIHKLYFKSSSQIISYSVLEREICRLQDTAELGPGEQKPNVMISGFQETKP